MATSLRKKIFLCIFCLASITQGMYSTYFVSILTTIERVYQIQSKTAGAILSATEIGQILGALLIAYYGGRGDKPRWIAACMTLSALAALISITPHFFLQPSNSVYNQATTDKYPELTTTRPSMANSFISSSPYPTSDLITDSTTQFLNKSSLRPATLSVTTQTPRVDSPNLEQLCLSKNFSEPLLLNSTYQSTTGNATLIEAPVPAQQATPVGLILVIFFMCLLAIGFGSTAITTLGIPFIDDIVSKEESPLYLGLTIGLRIFGPAFGFLLGSFCIRLDTNIALLNDLLEIGSHATGTSGSAQTLADSSAHIGAWWLGLIIISIPLLILALPMYYLSRTIGTTDSQKDDFEDITYQAAEDHDIGGSHDFQPHLLAFGARGDDLDVTSDKTCFSSEVDSSSREVLQSHQQSPMRYQQYHNYSRNIAFEQPNLTSEDIFENNKNNKSANGQDTVDMASGCAQDDSTWHASVNLIVNHFGGMEPSSFTNNELATPQDCKPQSSSVASSTCRSSNSTPPLTNGTKHARQQPQHQQQAIITDISSTLSRLIKNKLLLLRIVSGVLHILPIAGFYTFLPKYLIEQFRVTSSSASAISGLAGILFVGFGAFLGGTIVSVFNVNSRMMTRWIASSALMYTIGMLILMNLGCAQNQTVYHNSIDFMSTDCMSACKCSSAVYNPVCANGTTYISPCLAGCRGYSISSDDNIIYEECGCSATALVPEVAVASGGMATNLIEPPRIKSVSAVPAHVNLNIATQGQCLIDCDNLIWYIIIFSIFTLIHASCEVGSMMFNLRCVKSTDRALALGLITFTSSLLGTIPCSIIYGTVVDLTCVHWDQVKTTASSLSIATAEATHGACRAYENDTFRYYLHGITAFVMFLAFIVDLIISRRAEAVDFYDGSESRGDGRIELKKSTETI